MLGVGVLAIDPPPGLAAARRAGFKIGDVTSPAPITNNPRKVARAIRNHQRVVILFQNPRGLDDQATAESVRALRAQTKAKVFTDDIRSVDRFGPIVQDVGVNQGPSIVIIDRARQGTTHRGLHRLTRPRSGSRRRPMSERQPGPAALRAVPDRGAEEAAKAETSATDSPRRSDAAARATSST